MSFKYGELISKFTKLLTKRIYQVLSCSVRYIDFILILLTHNQKQLEKLQIENELVLTTSEIDVLPVCHINQKDKLIAQFNQSNDQLSHLSINDNQQTEFVARQRNIVSLVLHNNQVCLMKCYENINCLINEVRALNKLKGITGVPKLIDVNIHKKQAYQSFMPGTSLAHSLIKQGCTEEEIYLYENEMSDNNDYPQRLFKDYGRKLVSDDFISQFKQLLNDIHKNDVLIRDVKFGNIINHNGTPLLVDFDCASILKNTKADKLRTFNENALFNRLLPLDLPTGANL